MQGSQRLPSEVMPGRKSGECTFVMKKTIIRMHHKRRRIIAEKAAEPVGAYPHATQAGPFLFISGIGPRRKGSSTIPGVVLDADGRVVDYDIEAQTHAVFANLRYILEAAGYAMDDVVDVMVFLTNMQADFKAFNRIYARYFGEIQPSRTTVEVGALPTPIAVELKVVAWKPPLTRQRTHARPAPRPPHQ